MMNKDVYVIAASKLWLPDICERLSQKVNAQFILITDKNDLNIENLKKINPKKIFLPHWSFIIKPEIFTQFECIVFHMTELPFGRGGSPLQNLIVRGLEKTKISAIRCAEGIDTGPIYLQKDLSLKGKAQAIFENAFHIILEMITHIIDKNPNPVAQQGEATIFKRRTPEESNISHLNNINKVYDYIRMLDADGYPNAFLTTENLVLSFSDAEIRDDFIEAKVRIKLK